MSTGDVPDKAAEEHWFASDLVRNRLQFLVLIVAAVSLILAVVGYNAQRRKERY